MKVCLLYENEERLPLEKYYDWNSISKDLSLTSFCKMASSGLVWAGGKVMYVQSRDDFLAETMEKVMRVPLTTEEQILYRQEILQDCLDNKSFVTEMYDAATDILEQWDKLGRKSNKGADQSPKAKLINNIRVMRLFVDGINRIKGILNSYSNFMKSKGISQLIKSLNEEFDNTLETGIEQILTDMSFFVDVTPEAQRKTAAQLKLPRFSVDFGIGDGMKFDDLKLEEFRYLEKDYAKPYGMKARLQNKLMSITKEGINIDQDTALKDLASQLEVAAVNYVYSCGMAYLKEFNTFFDQIRFQMGFYLAAINSVNQMRRYGMDWCLPTVGNQDCMEFEELREVVMGMEQEIEVVGNTCNENGKMLFIVTGANQGGKSTFLRSIGIAQILLQCGLPVAAKKFKSGIYPNFFTHFTRREDSAMNSGRLDEELRRMDQIINNLGKDSLILLNESFASTTELDGSEIEYDIIKALLEENVKIITVTHLLSFAKKMYQEYANKEGSGVEFLSAERLEDGTRTYHMRKREPQLTSFGLDLYKQVVGEV